ncbi:MAG: hypothetical protein HPY50_07310 [Firmicutes bacterium]|nr:hypothetical protein [Bacillota bacterium]
MLVGANGLNLYARWKTRGPRLDPRHAGFARKIMGRYGFSFSAFPRSLDLVFRMYPGLGSRVGDTWYSLLVNLRLQLLQNQYQQDSEKRRTLPLPVVEMAQRGGYQHLLNPELVLQRFRDYLFSVPAERTAVSGAAAPEEDRRLVSVPGMESELAERIIRMYLGGIEKALPVGPDVAAERVRMGAAPTVAPAGESRAVPLLREPSSRLIQAVPDGAAGQDARGGSLIRSTTVVSRAIPLRQETKPWITTAAEQRPGAAEGFMPNAEQRPGVTEGFVPNAEQRPGATEGFVPNAEQHPGAVEDFVPDAEQRPGAVEDFVPRAYPVRLRFRERELIYRQRTEAEPRGERTSAARTPTEERSAAEGADRPGLDHDVNINLAERIILGQVQMMQRLLRLGGGEGPGSITPAVGSGTEGTALTGQAAVLTDPARVPGQVLPHGPSPDSARGISEDTEISVLEGTKLEEESTVPGVPVRPGLRRGRREAAAGFAAPGAAEPWRMAYSSQLTHLIQREIHQREVDRAAEAVGSLSETITARDKGYKAPEPRGMSSAVGSGPDYSTLLYQTLMMPINQEVVNKGLAFNQQVYQNQLLQRAGQELLNIVQGTGASPLSLIRGRKGRVQEYLPYQEESDGPDVSAQPAWGDYITAGGWGYPAGELVFRQLADMGYPDRGALAARPAADQPSAGDRPLTAEQLRIDRETEVGLAERIILSQFKQVQGLLRTGGREASSAASYIELETAERPPGDRGAAAGMSPMAATRASRVLTPGPSAVGAVNRFTLINRSLAGAISTIGDRMVLRDSYRYGEKVFTYPGTVSLGWLSPGSQLTRQVQKEIRRWREAVREARTYPAAGEPETTPARPPAVGEEALLTNIPAPARLASREPEGEAVPPAPYIKIGTDREDGRPPRHLGGGAGGAAETSVLQTLNQGLGLLINHGVIDRELVYNRQVYLNQTLQRVGEMMLRTIQGAGAGVSPYSLLSSWGAGPPLTGSAMTGAAAAASALMRGPVYPREEMVYRRWAGMTETERQQSVSAARPAGPETPAAVDGSMIEAAVMAVPMSRVNLDQAMQRLGMAQAAGYGSRLPGSITRRGFDRPGRTSGGFAPVLYSLVGRQGGYRSQAPNAYRASISAIREVGTAQRLEYLLRTGTDEMPVSTARPARGEVEINAVPLTNLLLESRLIDRVTLEQVRVQRQMMQTGGSGSGAPGSETVGTAERLGRFYSGMALIVHNLTGHLSGSMQVNQVFPAYPGATGDRTPPVPPMQYQTREIPASPMLLSTLDRRLGGRDIGTGKTVTNILIKSGPDSDGYGRLTALENVVRQIRGLNEVRFGTGSQAPAAAPLDHRREAQPPANEGGYITPGETMNRQYIHTETSISPASVPAQSGLNGVDVKRIADQIIREVEQKTRFDRKRRGL